MVVIREADAVSYLDRVDYSIAKLKQDNPPWRLPKAINWIPTMIGIQRAYLSVLMDDPETSSMAAITITPTGFPEIPSWTGDLGRAFRRLEGSKKRRTTAYLPLLDSVGAKEDIEREIIRISSVVATDNNLNDILGSEENKEVTDYIKSWAAGSSPSPLLQDDERGMIIFKYQDYKNSVQTALKYVDNLGGPPLFYYSHENDSDHPAHFDGTFSGGTLEFEELKEMSYPLKALLLAGDYTLTGVDGFEVLYTEMLTYHQVLRDLREKSNFLLDGRALDSTQYAEDIREINRQLNSLTENASSDELREAFRDSLGADVNSLRWKGQRIVGEPTAILVPKQKSRLSRFFRRFPRIKFYIPK